MEKGAIWYMWRWSKKYVLKYKMRFVWITILTLAYVALSLLQVNFIQQSIDAALLKNWQIMTVIICVFALITIIRILRNYFYGESLNYIDVNISRDVKNDLVAALMNIKMKHISIKSSGDLITNQNNDIQTALSFIRDGYSNFLVFPLMAISSFIYLLFFNWKLSVIVFITLPVFSIILNRMSSRAGLIQKEILEKRGIYMEAVYDASHGAETIKAYSMQNYIHKKTVAFLNKIYHKEVQYSFNGSITLGLIMAVSYIPDILALLYGGVLVMRGEIAVSVLFAFSQLIAMVNTPVINVFSSLNALKESYQSMKRLDMVLLADEERKDGQSFDIEGDIAIQFENVSFGYSNDDIILKDVNLTLNCGKYMGISGVSGAGKSTLINLISGFYEADKGCISIFGKAINTWELNKLRDMISCVSQENHILPGTIFENIQYGKPDAEPDEVVSAATKAGLITFIDSLPMGFDTVLFENGANLSGGQRQRIDLARAFLKDAPIFIFDESTSALDEETEAFVMLRIRELTKDKSVIIISHKPSMLDICDEIYYINDGRLEKHADIN